MSREKEESQRLDDPAYLTGSLEPADPANRTHPGLDFYGSPFVNRSFLPVLEEEALERKRKRLLQRYAHLRKA